MSRLDDAVRSVPADSSPADESGLDPNEDFADDADAAGYADDGDGEPDGKKERSVENVRGELLRKMQKSQQELMQELQALREESRARNAAYGVPSSPEQPKTLDDMSIADLESMSSSVPEEQLPAFQQYLQERKIAAKVDERLNSFQHETQFKQSEQKYNTTAFERWPDLRNKSSDFYRTADRILSEMGPAAAKNPRAVLDAANEAGLELGLTPQTGIVRNTRRSDPSKVVPGRTTKGTRASEDADVDQSIATRLSNAMPGRKFTDEQLKRIAKRQKLYKESINTHIRG